MWKPHQPQLVTTDACPSLSLITGLFKCFPNLYFKICWHVWKNYLCPLDAGAHLNLAPCCTMLHHAFMKWLFQCRGLSTLRCAPQHTLRCLWNEPVFSLSVWLDLKYTEVSWLEKIFILINRLHKGWWCCSIINFVSPWVVSEQGNVFYCYSLTLV